MSKNKQPRDGNGKFTKMIKVTDKFGNAAYFTPEEMEGFNKATPKNPDCEPATKGYVKDLMRKTREHTHTYTYFGFLTLTSVVFGWILTALFGLLFISTTSYEHVLGDKYFIPLLLFSIAVTCILCEFEDLKCDAIKEPTPRELYRYTPPRKDECEE